MDPRSIAVLEELLRFRDEKAGQRDIPPFKILGNDAIRELAVKLPRKAGDLANTAGLSPKLMERYGQDILDAVAKGMALPASALPAYPRFQRPVRDRLQEERLKRLKLWREARSREIGIDGGILANNALLENLSEMELKKDGDVTDALPMKRWQKELFGAELVELLRRM
jgi:ribonuclease D